jgi:hypothetical protein
VAPRRARIALIRPAASSLGWILRSILAGPAGQARDLQVQAAWCGEFHILKGASIITITIISIMACAE